MARVGSLFLLFLCVCFGVAFWILAVSMRDSSIYWTHAVYGKDAVLMGSWFFALVMSKWMAALSALLVVALFAKEFFVASVKVRVLTNGAALVFLAFLVFSSIFSFLAMPVSDF